MITDTEFAKRSTWQKGLENPYTTDVVTFPIIHFNCPICESLIEYSDSRVDPFHGKFFQCHKCKIISHVSGGTIFGPHCATACILLPISNWSEWYYNHPMTKNENMKFHDYYGLWAFCAKCYHQYQVTVLSMLATVKESLKYVNGDAFFKANAEKSAADMKALIAGKCPTCEHDTVMAVMTDIPDHVHQEINLLKAREARFSFFAHSK